YGGRGFRPRMPIADDVLQDPVARSCATPIHDYGDVPRGRPWHATEVRTMSAETSVPRPRESDVDISDSALLKGLLSEAEFAFAFFDVEGRIQRVNDVFGDLAGAPAERLVGSLP